MTNQQTVIKGLRTQLDELTARVEELEEAVRKHSHTLAGFSADGQVHVEPYRFRTLRQLEQERTNV